MNLSTLYMAFSSIVLFIAVVRINQLEKLIGASVDKRIPGILASHSAHATCVWSRADWMIEEFIAAHLAQGIVDYTFFVDDPATDLVSAVESNYTNFGLPIRFKEKSDKYSDLWSCVTDHVFRPMTHSVLVTEVDMVMFPLNDKFDTLSHARDSHPHCTKFDTFDFTDSGDVDERYPSSVVSSHRRRVRGRHPGPTMHFLGATVEDRIQFLRTSRRQSNCTKSKQYGTARYLNNSAPYGVVDKRPYYQKERYYVNKFFS